MAGDTVWPEEDKEVVGGILEDTRGPAKVDINEGTVNGLPDGDELTCGAVGAVEQEGHVELEDHGETPPIWLKLTACESNEEPGCGTEATVNLLRMLMIVNCTLNFLCQTHQLRWQP